MAPTTFKESIALEQISDGEYVSKHLPERMGNTAPIAYGGCALSIALAAAHQTVDAQYHLYSAQGNYLGPASTKQILHASVRTIRTTKSFATRQVEISQDISAADGKSGNAKRVCLILIADFHVKESQSVLTYSAAPDFKFSPVEQCPTISEAYADAVKQGVVTEQRAQLRHKLFALMARYFEQKIVPEGFSEQIVGGFAKTLRTTQDHLSITERTSMDWFKNRVPLATAAEQCCALSFEMDGKVSFVAGLHDRLFLDDVGACSSLDFSLRVFTTDLNLNDWHLRQFKTVAGGEARTFSEAKLWDRNGKIVAYMTQQSILRPKPEQQSKSKSSL